MSLEVTTAGAIDDESGTTRPRFRSDSLASLADPRRAGTFASDLARASKIRSQIDSIRYRAQQFAILELPKIGRSDAERRRKRMRRKRGQRANGPQWFAEKAERRTLQERRREIRWKGATQKSYLEDSSETRRKRVKERKELRARLKVELKERRNVHRMKQWQEAKELREARRRWLSQEAGGDERSPWKQPKQRLLAFADDGKFGQGFGSIVSSSGSMQVKSQKEGQIYSGNDNDENGNGNGNITTSDKAMSLLGPPKSPPPAQQDRYRLRAIGSNLGTRT